MNKQPWLLNLNLLKAHPAFRAVFLARSISIVSLGLLSVAVPMQIQMMIHSTQQAGLSATPTGGAISIGLMVGSVLADRYGHKKVILLTRGTCGVGFIGLCLNTLLPEQSLLAIYLLSLWDSFFASLGVTALLMTTSVPTGHENLMQTGVITMLIVRLGSVISPMIGGLLLVTGGVAWSYGLTAVGTFIILLPLLNLPALPPPLQPCEYPLRSLPTGFRFLPASPLAGGIVLLEGLLMMADAMRVLYLVLADNWRISTVQTDFPYMAIPLGAAIGTLASGRLAHSVRPGLLISLFTLGVFLVIGLFGLMSIWILGVVCLVLFGWLSAVSSLLQYTML